MPSTPPLRERGRFWVYVDDIIILWIADDPQTAADVAAKIADLVV